MSGGSYCDDVSGASYPPLASLQFVTEIQKTLALRIPATNSKEAKGECLDPTASICTVKKCKSYQSLVKKYNILNFVIVA